MSQNRSMRRCRPRRPKCPVRPCLRRATCELPVIYRVVVECTSERDQRRVYERMRAEGRKCRVLTL